MERNLESSIVCPYHLRVWRTGTAQISMRPRFTAPLLPCDVNNHVLATSRTKYIKGSEIGATIHSFRGATTRKLIDVVQQYYPLKIRSVNLVFRFNDHSTDNFHSIECYRLLKDLIRYKFNPSVLIALIIIPSTNNRLINYELYLKNCAIFKWLYYCYPHVVSPFFNLSPFMLCRDCLILLILVIVYSHLYFFF